MRQTNLQTKLISEAKDMIFQETGLGVIVMDASGVIIEINKAAIRMAGISTPSPVGKSLADLSPHLWKRVDLHAADLHIYKDIQVTGSIRNESLIVKITKLKNGGKSTQGYFLELHSEELSSSPDLKFKNDLSNLELTSI